MLSKTKRSLLKQLVQNASQEEIIWTKGYLAGYLDNNYFEVIIEEDKPIENVVLKPLVIYGTETGNSKKVASQIVAGFKKNKVQGKSIDVFQYDFTKIEKEKILLFVMSTQGEGEFPQNALKFYNYLRNTDVKFKNTSYAVFGLGDSSYPLFCNAGILLDQILEEKGAKRLLPLVKGDVDYSSEVVKWENDLLNIFKEQSVKSELVEFNADKVKSHKKNYFGKVTNNIVLNDIGSNKETYHIEISTEEKIHYTPGDALGIIPKNELEEVHSILDFFKEEGEKKLTIGEDTKTLQEWFLNKNIRGLSRRSLISISELFGIVIEFEKADLIDVLRLMPNVEGVKIESLIEILLPIAPRLYSISSSPEAHEGEVHLTVNLNKFHVEDVEKKGLGSQFLAELSIGDSIEFYIHKNQNFKLPNEDVDIIMIGPGTGIAPFRSFLAHRDALGSEGKNWLFFGEQHFVLDFYYQIEIQDWINTGVLTKLDTAFSRDQENKIYVQDRILQNAKEFNHWLENGASLYICGQKNPMSTDVEEAILKVLVQERRISLDEAKELLDNLESEGKYQKDVY